MSRKDYERLAAALKWTKPSNPVCPPSDYKKALLYGTKTWEDTAVSIADALAADNSRFNRDRFYKACGLGQ